MLQNIATVGWNPDPLLTTLAPWVTFLLIFSLHFYKISHFERNNPFGIFVRHVCILCFLLIVCVWCFIYQGRCVCQLYQIPQRPQGSIWSHSKITVVWTCVSTWRKSNRFYGLARSRSCQSICFFLIFIIICCTVKTTLVQCWIPAALACPSIHSASSWGPSAGHHFHWQLVNKSKYCDAGFLSLPPVLAL